MSNFYAKNKSIFLNGKMMTVMLTAASITAIIILASYANGPAKHRVACTGAPFNSGRTCANCHSGGNFGGAMTTRLIDTVTNTVVTSYIPGKTYKLRIRFTRTSGTPKYAFQTTAAKLSTLANVNKWGTLPAGVHNTLLSGHNYVEQSKSLTTATITIRWTGPAKGSGSVIFYTAGNLVNGNGSANGDQPVKASLTITEAPVAASPVQFVNFKGNISNNTAILTWATLEENNLKQFTIEKSYNAHDYFSMGTVNAKGNGDYTFTDKNFSGTAYYRLKITDNENNISYNNPLTLSKKYNYDLSLYANGGKAYIRFYNPTQAQEVQVAYTNLQGNLLYSYMTQANKGENIWPIYTDKVKGVGIVNVTTSDGIRTSLKLGIQK